MDTPPREQRAFPRQSLVLRADFADREGALGATENLSASGLFVQTDAPLQMGEKVTLVLSFPGLLSPIEVGGEVAWLRAARADAPAGVGIRLVRAQDRKRLGDLLTSAESAARSPMPATGSAGYRVLIVEDNPHIIEMYSYALKKLASTELGGKVPLEVHFSVDGHQALTQLRQGGFNLVMTDLYMPVMDGFALVERIRQEASLQNIPVIAISAGGKEAQDRALEAGVDVFLRKPVRFLEVLDTVKQLLRINK